MWLELEEVEVHREGVERGWQSGERKDAQVEPAYLEEMHSGLWHVRKHRSHLRVFTVLLGTRYLTLSPSLKGTILKNCYFRIRWLLECVSFKYSGK